MIRMVRHLTIGLTLAVGLAVSAAAQPLEIKVGAAYASDHAPVFAAVERGIFAKHGLDAKVVMYQTGVEMINGLLNGAQDVNVMGSIPLLAGVSNGQPLLLIGHLHGDATKQSYAANYSIVTTPASGIKEGDIKGLKGKRIALPRGTGAEGYILGLLTQNGMKPTDVTLLNIKPGDAVTALRQADADALSAYEPWASTAALRVPGAFRVVSASCESCYDPGTVLSDKKAVANKPEQLRRFMIAFAEAEQWVRNNPDAAAEINMRWIQGVDLDVMKLAIRHSNYDPRLSKNDFAGYKEKTIPQLVADKRMAKAVDPKSFIDPQFYLNVEKVAPQFFSDLPPIPAAERLN
jgi:sulfonate transport system substrate-binding protein